MQYLPFLAYALSMLLIGGSIFLAFQKTDNWGWFLIAGLALVPSSQLLTKAVC